MKFISFFMISTLEICSRLSLTKNLLQGVFKTPSTCPLNLHRFEQPEASVAGVLCTGVASLCSNRPHKS